MRFKIQMGSLAFDRDRHFFNIRYLAGLDDAGTLEEIRSEFRGEGLSLDIAWSKSSKLADGGWAGLRVSLNYDNVCLEAVAIIF